MIECKQSAPNEWTEFYGNIYSQFGEDGIIEEIFRRIGTTNKQCFEVGAADGKWFSNSRRLIDDGWSAVLIEANEKNWPQLDKLDNPPKVNVVHGKAEPDGPNSLDSILSMAGFDKSMDLGVIDVDGQDYYLWNGMIKYLPRVMVVEYEKFVDHDFVPDLNGEGQAGRNAIASIAVSKGYFNAAMTHSNMIFIRNDCKDKFNESIKNLGKKEESGITVRKSEPEVEHVVRGYDPNAEKKNENKKSHGLVVPTITTGKEEEVKICAILSRPRFGLNIFFDCASEALAPWGIPIQSFYGVFWNQCMERAFEDNIASGMDWILTLDYDSLITSKHIQILINALAQNPHIDAIAPLQCRRGRPLPLAVRMDGTMPLTGGPVQVRTAHFGCTIFRCSSIKKMKEKPWFGEVPAKDGSWGEGRMDPDIAFWARWGSAGNTIFIETSAKIGHVEEMVSEFDEQGKLSHSYLSDWRKRNGHTIKNFE